MCIYIYIHIYIYNIKNLAYILKLFTFTYIPWIVIFLRFMNTKISYSPSATFISLLS